MDRLRFFAESMCGKELLQQGFCYGHCDVKEGEPRNSRPYIKIRATIDDVTDVMHDLLIPLEEPLDVILRQESRCETIRIGSKIELWNLMQSGRDILRDDTNILIAVLNGNNQYYEQVQLQPDKDLLVFSHRTESPKANAHILARSYHPIIQAHGFLANKKVEYQRGTSALPTTSTDGFDYLSQRLHWLKQQ